MKIASNLVKIMHKQVKSVGNLLVWRDLAHKVMEKSGFEGGTS